jgi:hypothetical protein
MGRSILLLAASGLCLLLAAIPASAAPTRRCGTIAGLPVSDSRGLSPGS